MAFSKGIWKKVAMGVVAASVGAAAFGYIHYMFLANYYPQGSIMGVSYASVFPIVLGALGLVLSYGWVHNETAKAIVMAGSAASIGFGIATAAGFIAPGSASARARAPVASMYVPPVRTAQAFAPTGAMNSAGIKLI